MGTLGNFRYLVEEHKYAFQADKPNLQVCNLRTKKLQRLVHLSDVGHDHQQRSHAQQASPDVDHACVHGGGCAAGDGQADQHVENGLHY